MRRALLAIALVVGGVVAGVVLFRPGPGPAPGSTPDALEPIPISPTVGSITSILVLDGAIRPVDPIEISASASGVIAQVIVKTGDRVTPDQELVEIAATGEGVVVRAPEAGVIAELHVTLGQSVAVGEAILALAPEVYLAEAVVPPDMLYRLYEPPLAMQAELDHGPPPFDCDFVSIGADPGGGNPLEAPVHIRCRVPDGIRVFAGIRARIIVTTGKVTHVLTVPVEAVSGTADSGLVWVVDSAGGVRSRSVKLGLTDGVRIQIISGLSPDEHILDIPPSSDAAASR